MTVSINCDECGKACEDDILCRSCADDCDCDCDEGAHVPDVGHEVSDLAAAIRRGDTPEAEALLDRIASEIEGWPHMVSVGRYSPAAL